MKQNKPQPLRGMLTGFILVIVLLMALAGVGLVYMRSMHDTITQIVEDNNQRARLATEMYIAARERAIQLYSILQEPDPFARDGMVPRFHELAGIFRGARQQLLRMNLSPKELVLLEQQNRYSTYGSELQDQILELALADRKKEAELTLITQAIPVQNQATLRLRQLLDEQYRNGRESAKDAREKYQTARGLMIASAIVASMLAALIAVVVVRRQAQLLNRLREREQEARVLLDNIPVPVWFKDTELRIAWFNPGFSRMTGLASEEVAGKRDTELWGEEEGRRSDEQDRIAMETGETARRDQRLVSLHDGQEGHYLIAHTPVTLRGVCKGVLCVAQDLTALERMYSLLEGANQELQAQKTALDEHAIVSITDMEGTITYVNDKFCSISGYAREEWLGQNHRLINSGLHPDEFFAQMWRTLTSGRVWHGEIRNRRRDGGFYWLDSTVVPFLDADGKPYQYIAIRTDITARKQMEESLKDVNVELQKRVEERTEALSRAMKQLETDIAERTRSQSLLQAQYQELESLHHKLQEAQTQLLQSEKLASIGQLAAGVAHEINNPIGFVQSNLGSLENYMRDLFTLIERYEATETALPPPPRDELAALKQRLDLSYLREDIPQLMSESREGITRVRKIIQDLKDFSRLDSSPDWQYADLHLGLDSTLNIVHNEIKYRAEVVKEYGDIPEIECLPSQLNQVFMNLLVNAAHAMEGPRGTITLRTDLADSGTEVWVEVADTGKGIPEEILGRIFDPFFTTKPVGKGTGLGLSLAYGIIQKHNGRIEVASEVGKGTTFRVTLPIKHAEAAAA